MTTNESVDDAVAVAYGGEWTRIVATLIRITGDWSLAEDCAQDAFALAVERWPREGVPRRPGAWLTTVARNRAIDRLRRNRSEDARLPALAREAAVMDDLNAWPGPFADDRAIEDDRLRLIFTCCHPALPLEARVALTLRTVAGLTTPEIASAFLVGESTMAQRLVRAKRKIAHAGIPYRVPPPHLLAERLTGVLAVLYVLFNEGYRASSGEALQRKDIAAEAVRIGRILAGVLPDEPEVLGLSSLMQFQHARRDARTDASGDLVTLEDQDRALWRRDEIEDGVRTLERARRLNAGRQTGPGRFALQAEIAACHATALTAEGTDLARIAALYSLLVAIDPSPVVALNQAVARGLAFGPEVGLAQLADLEGEARLAGYYLLPAAQADLLRRLGRHREAADRYRAARELAPTEPERRYLAQRLEALVPFESPPPR